MKEIIIFENVEFGAIRTMSDEQGEPLFCGKDVCDALQHTNSRRAIAKLVDEGDVTKRYTPEGRWENEMVSHLARRWGYKTDPHRGGR